jgi:hypothetical protein
VTRCILIVVVMATVQHLYVEDTLENGRGEAGRGRAGRTGKA